jgi:predicted O-linked N-acetylglucosamine transferase (SPINDLY family)
LWAEILRRVPESRLRLQSPAGSHQGAVRSLFQDRGVDPERIEFLAPRPRALYLRLYQDLDLGLDPFPYNGHNSTLEALWMGVPVVTLAGCTAVGRGGVSILSNAGLPELIAQTPEEYLAIAVQLAGRICGRGSRHRRCWMPGSSPPTSKPRFGACGGPGAVQ